MSSNHNLKLDWCSLEAATFAVKNWHYSKKMPVGKLVKIGVWEDNRFIGCVLFSRGANNNIGKPFGLEQTEICELTRVALSIHKSHVTRILAIAIKMLRKKAPGLRMIVSYADPQKGHEGTIYKAGNWIYLGKNKTATKLIVNGKVMHRRSVSSKWGNPKNIPGEYHQTEQLYIHKFVYILDKSFKLENLRPKHKSNANDTPIIRRRCNSDLDAFKPI